MSSVRSAVKSKDPAVRKLKAILYAENSERATLVKVPTSSHPSRDGIGNPRCPSFESILGFDARTHEAWVTCEDTAGKPHKFLVAAQYRPGCDYNRALQEVWAPSAWKGELLVMRGGYQSFVVDIGGSLYKRLAKEAVRRFLIETHNLTDKLAQETMPTIVPNLQRVDREVASLRKGLNAANDQILELEAETALERSSKERLQMELRRSAQRIDADARKLLELEEHHMKTLNEYDDAKVAYLARYRTLEATHAALQLERDMLSENLKDTETERNDWRSKCEARESLSDAASSACEGRVRFLEAENSSLQCESSHYREKCDGLWNQVQELTDALETAKTDYVNLEFSCEERFERLRSKMDCRRATPLHITAHRAVQTESLPPVVDRGVQWAAAAASENLLVPAHSSSESQHGERTLSYDSAVQIVPDATPPSKFLLTMATILSWCNGETKSDCSAPCDLSLRPWGLIGEDTSDPTLSGDDLLLTATTSIAGDLDQTNPAAASCLDTQDEGVLVERTPHVATHPEPLTTSVQGNALSLHNAEGVRNVLPWRAFALPADSAEAGLGRFTKLVLLGRLVMDGILPFSTMLPRCICTDKSAE
ncbi:hypothetical protein L227DRAFT_605654 [Lentinus tigrinus ALCF2SS1-6]|uniref:Uncharacterized protein n=1 Tax=Lentinus tigrinus ALCF2SS1-6 TaxID=1328759 RepID=A0A5C2SUX7_9APHY|nr:hypothetical protein L227DRAFT_605654 [Lentinus tigrinus ALCF2SS1-6]